MSTAALRALWLVVLPVLVTVSAARGQQPMAEFVGANQPLFVEDDLRELARIYTLSPDQKTATEILLRSGVERAQAIYTKLMKQAPWGNYQDDGDQVPEDEEARQKFYETRATQWQRMTVEASRRAAAIEREVLSDVESLLNKDQAEKGWTEFDKYRRRIMVEGQGWYWFGCDPSSVLKAAKVSEADMKAAGPVLERHGQIVDELLIQRMNELRTINDELLRTGHMDDDWWNHPALRHRELRRANVRAISDIEKVISEEGGAAVRRKRVSTEMSLYFQPPEQDPGVATVLAVASLNPEQKARMQQHVEEASDDLFQIATGALKQQDELILRGEEVSAIAEPMKALQKRAKQRLAALVKALKGELSEAQRSELEAGPVSEETVDQLFKQKRAALPEIPWKTSGKGGPKAAP